MKRVLVDTNVVLDVLLGRQPHVVGSSAVWAAVETGAVKGFLAAHAVTTIHYLVGRELGQAKATRMISSILRVFDVAGVDRTTLEVALQRSLPDFEDAVSAAAAQASGCEAIITRDPKGFRGVAVRVLTPEAFLPLIGI